MERPRDEEVVVADLHNLRSQELELVDGRRRPQSRVELRCIVGRTASEACPIAAQLQGADQLSRSSRRTNEELGAVMPMGQGHEPPGRTFCSVAPINMDLKFANWLPSPCAQLQQRRNCCWVEALRRRGGPLELQAVSQSFQLLKDGHGPCSRRMIGKWPISSSCLRAPPIRAVARCLQGRPHAAGGASTDQFDRFLMKGRVLHRTVDCCLGFLPDLASCRAASPERPTVQLRRGVRNRIFLPPLADPQSVVGRCGPPNLVRRLFTAAAINLLSIPPRNAVLASTGHPHVLPLHSSRVRPCLASSAFLPGLP